MEGKKPILTPLRIVFASAVLTALVRKAQVVPILSSLVQKALEYLKFVLNSAYGAVDTLQKALAKSDAENSRLKQENRNLRQALAKSQAAQNANSSNSSRPPSSDSPYRKRAGGRSRRRGGSGAMPRKAHHEGKARRRLEPTEHRSVAPDTCPGCGCHDFASLREEYVHQCAELPDKPLDIIDFHVLSGRCTHCGERVAGKMPPRYAGPFGTRLEALAGEMSIGMGCTRRFIQRCFSTVYKLPLSQGGIQNILDRISEAIRPHWHAGAQACRRMPFAHVDETHWRMFGPWKKALEWLWVMVSPVASFFMIHPRRSREAFEELIDDWEGWLISDDLAVCRSWRYGRQSCLAHLLRHAQKLSEDPDRDIASCGRLLKKHFQKMVAMSKSGPNEGDLKSWIRGVRRCVSKHMGMDNDAGVFCRRIASEMDALTACLRRGYIEPTNNIAERALRHPVMRRRASIGTTTDKGDRLIERGLSLRQTCLLHDRSLFDELVEALSAVKENRRPRIRWIQTKAIRAAYDQYQAGA